MPLLHEITTDLVYDKAMVVCAANAGGWGFVPVVAEDLLVVDVGGPGLGRGEGVVEGSYHAEAGE